MDMARAPKLDDLKHLPRSQAAASGELRLISAKEATDPRFIKRWQHLAGEASEPNPFFEPWCLIPALKHLHAESRLALYTLVDGGILRGLMPVAKSPRYYGYPIPHIATWLHANAFCGAPLVAKGYEQAFWHAVLSRLDEKPSRAMFLHAPSLPANGSTAQALATVAERDGRPCLEVSSEERAMLKSHLSPEEYLEQSLTKKRRKELRRLFKRLSECGDLRLEQREDAADISDWIREFLTLESAGWKGEAGSALGNAAPTREFFKEALFRAAKAGRLQRLALRVDTRPVAMLANFVTPPGIFSFKTAFDENYARFSPGLLLQLENLSLLERGDIDWADSCAAEGHSMIERLWREKRRIVSVNVAIGGRARRFAARRLMAYETRGKSQ